MAQPCLGSGDIVLRIRRSSVPWTRSVGLATTPRLPTSEGDRQASLLSGGPLPIKICRNTRLLGTSSESGKMAFRGRNSHMVLVVGATGLVGTEVCRRLRARGEPVRALVRSTSAGE